MLLWLIGASRNLLLNTCATTQQHCHDLGAHEKCRICTNRWTQWWWYDPCTNSTDSLICGTAWWTRGGVCLRECWRNSDHGLFPIVILRTLEYIANTWKVFRTLKHGYRTLVNQKQMFIVHDPSKNPGIELSSPWSTHHRWGYILSCVSNSSQKVAWGIGKVKGTCF